jgi:hypothetical protein
MRTGPHAFCGEDRVEGVGEFRVSVADQKPELTDPLAQVHDQIPGLLGHPFPGRIRCRTEQVNLAGGDLDDEQDVDAFEPDRVHVEEVAGQDCFGLVGEELVQVGPARRGAGSTPAVCRIFHTVLADTRYPNPTSSP